MGHYKTAKRSDGYLLHGADGFEVKLRWWHFRPYTRNSFVAELVVKIFHRGGPCRSFF